jgi:hypothetical protein
MGSRALSKSLIVSFRVALGITGTG